MPHRRPRRPVPSPPLVSASASPPPPPPPQTPQSKPFLAALRPLASAAAALLFLRRASAPAPDSEHTPDHDHAHESPPSDRATAKHDDTEVDNAHVTDTDSNLITKIIQRNQSRIPKLPKLPPADWDWSDLPDDASIWATTAAILAGARVSRDDDEDDNDADSLARKFRDATDTLSAALRGLSAQPKSLAYPPSSSSVSDDDDDRNATSADLDADMQGNDFRPLIAVTIGVTFFLLTRSAKVARRPELEQGTPDGTIGVDAADDSRDYTALSDLSARPRSIVIVTTAALPWMTGTSINPLLRAMYLAKAGHAVTLVVPWLESPEDQRTVYPSGITFQARSDQAGVIRAWAAAQEPSIELDVCFYEGVYSREFGSILPLGDITALFDEWPAARKDVVVLEEPEHLTWFHTGKSWTKLFSFCIGVVHTNYLEYAKKHGVFGPQRALFLSFLNRWVCRSYCHRVIKLSDAVQTLPNCSTCNVHGVRDSFLHIGAAADPTAFERGFYFLGKVLWTKGYRELCDLLDAHYAASGGERLAIDLFGNGPDLAAVKERVTSSTALAAVAVHGVVLDHAHDYLQKYKVYVNPSRSDVVCTATAEALAMGKFVICLKHPSNAFFEQFNNCLQYETPEQFSQLFRFASANTPKKLSQHELHTLSWRAATQRFYDAARVPNTRATGGRGRVDSALALTHKTICATLVTPPANYAVRARYKKQPAAAPATASRERVSVR